MKVIAVDDNEINLALLEAILEDMESEFLTFLDPLVALEHAKETPDIDVLLVDYMMPKMDGIEFIEHFHTLHPSAIIIMITAAADTQGIKIKALQAGATEFLPKPIEPIELKNRLRNLYKLKQTQNALKTYNISLQKDISHAAQSLQQREYETLSVLSNLAEYKDPETGSHINRVAHYSKMLAYKLGLSPEESDVIFYASPLHDMGKVGIPDSILLKPGKLTDDEFNIMKTHAEIGYQILCKAENPYLKAGAIICISHHEKYNGKGYPAGISGKDIPLYGRITAIADVFDALTSSRPYKRAWTFDEAMTLIEQEKNQHFDPELAQIFIDNRDAVKTIFTKFEEDNEQS